MPNCPLRSSQNIIDQLKEFEKLDKKRSLISGFGYGMFNPLWAHEKKGNKYFKVFNKISNKTRSQDLPKLICPSGAIWISTFSNLKKYNSFYSEDYFFYEHSWIDSIDIDEIDDLKLARLAFKIKNEKI